MVQARSDLWVRQSPMPVYEGEVLVLSVKWPNAGTVLNPTTSVQKNGSDYTSTVQVSGDTNRKSGSIQTAKKITVQSGDFGQSYVVIFEADVDGQHQKVGWQLDVHRAGEEM